jgi:fucose permease
VTLMSGRLITQSILPRVRRRPTLAGGIALSLFGCLVLALTDNRFGAMTGILFLGAGFSPVYPVVAQKISDRFPHYHPGFYGGIISIAIAGAYLAPCMLAYLVTLFAVQIVMLLPVFGSIVVLVLLTAIWAESRAGGQRIRSEASPREPV